MSDRHLSPAEAAAKLGLTPKALKHYERYGLVRPLRAGNGYRAYGPAEMARLHQVLALKQLGLPLAQIARILRDTQTSLETVLALQETMLRRESGRISRALALIGAARARLNAGDRLSVDDLANLTTETTMVTKARPEELETIFKPLIEKHFTESELTEIATRKTEPGQAEGVWEGLMAEAKALMDQGNPSSPEAIDLARRWKAMIEAFTGGDPGLAGKVKAVWNDAFADPAAAPKLPASPALFAFMGQAVAALKAQENR